MWRRLVWCVVVPAQPRYCSLRNALAMESDLILLPEIYHTSGPCSSGTALYIYSFV
jgi:hypothetical protein